mmetsp:Transcript_29629/g.62294  ORF Transcript_29629/g.62294 Transcript_29629/m.62294 type:complete len:179 (+) Transcript_29629:2455-2991(+)
MDYSENSAILNYDKVHAEHWKTTQYTLFISIDRFLLMKEWLKTEGPLPLQSRVTVHGDLFPSSTLINPASFFAVVSKNIGNSLYVVADVDGNKMQHNCRNLHYQVWHHMAFGHISDDKVHDCFAMQFFTNKEIAYLKQYVAEHFAENAHPDGHFNSFHHHSDNALHFFFIFSPRSCWK